MVSAVRRSLMAFSLVSHQVSQLMKTKLSSAPVYRNIGPTVNDIIHRVAINDE